MLSPSKVKDRSQNVTEKVTQVRGQRTSGLTVWLCVFQFIDLRVSLNLVIHSMPHVAFSTCQVQTLIKVLTVIMFCFLRNEEPFRRLL